MLDLLVMIVGMISVEPVRVRNLGLGLLTTESLILVEQEVMANCGLLFESINTERPTAAK